MASVSIIVAAYNVEKTIGRALESAIHQTMEDIEILCMEDCSTDATAEILRRYAEQDPRIRVVYHTENRGPAAVRYDGVMAAAGEYVLFLDGDDAYAPNACECLYQEMKRRSLDILHYGAVLIPDETHPPEKQVLAWLERYFSRWPAQPLCGRQQLLSACFGKGELQWNLWNKMYSRALLQKALAAYGGERICMAEDMLFTFMILYHAQAYGYTKQPFYCYRVGGGISTQSGMTPQKMQAIAEEYQAYSLLTKWLPAPKKKECGYASALRFVKDEICTAIQSSFLQQTPVQDCPYFLQQILQYYPAGEFVLDLADAVYTKGLASPEQAALRLRDCAALFPRPAAIQTVAAYYHRLFNGGVERVISLLAPIWQRAGYRVLVITEEGPTEQDYPLPETVPHLQIGKAGNDPSARIHSWKQMIRQYQIDAVVYNAWASPDRIFDAVAIKAQGAAFLLYAHSLATFNFSLPGYQGYCQQDTDALSDVVVTLSEVDQAWWSALGLRSVQTVNPCTYAPGETAVSPLTSRDAVWVGRLSPEKRVYDAFEIAQLVHAEIPDFRLRIVGKTDDDALLEEIYRYIAQRGMASYVLLEGFHPDVAPYYQSASVMLSTSEYEGFPITFL